MECTEPLIPGRLTSTIITIKVLVMQLVIEIADLETNRFLEAQLIKPGMGRRCSDTMMKHQEQHMDRVSRHNQKDHYIRH